MSDHKSPLFAALLLFGVDTPVHATVNVEDMRLGPAKAGWSSTVDLSFAGDRGNTEERRVSVGGRVQYNREPNTTFLVANYDYSESRGVSTKDKAFAHLRNIHQFTQRWAGEAFAQLQSDEFADLERRRLLGAGARRTLSEREALGMYLGVGAFYEWEDYLNQPPTAPSTANTWRASSYLTVKWALNENLRMLSTTYYQPSLETGGDYRLLEELSFMAKATQHLGFKLSLIARHDARPPVGVDKTDIGYTFGLVAEF